MARSKNPVPQIPGQIPSQNHIFRDFGGLNTQSSRHSIKPDQFSWLENVMPIGHGNAKVVKAISAIKATLASTVYYSRGFNRSNTAYLFAACSDGSAYQINLSTYAVVNIAAAATFPSSGTQIAQWKNERILIVNSTNYYDWDGATLTVLGGTTSAPVGGQCIATYAGRVWISNGRTINYSAASSYTSFAGSGGNTIITDETLTSDIRQLVAANNFLYFFGDDSINVIADVQVTGGVTQFSNTNISANSGTNLPQTIIAYYRAIWYMNTSGIFGLYGATARKASDELDGIFPLIDFTKAVTAGTVEIYNILCAAFLFTYNDPSAGARKLMAVYFNKKWFLASQLDGLSVMATNHTSGVDALYGFDTVNLYKMFDSSTDAVTHTMQTALWDMNEYVREKEALKLGIEAVLPGGQGSVSPTVDTESYTDTPSGTFASSFTFTWLNGSGAAFSWVNGASNPFTWYASGYAWMTGDVETSGHYLGVTVRSSTAQVQYIGVQLQYRHLAGGWWS